LVQARWAALVGDSPDREFHSSLFLLVAEAIQALASFPTSKPSTETSHKPFYKNWDGITETILSSEKPLTSNEDPNAGGDSTVNKFFQDIYSNSNEETKRAMMKSFVESGGTTLSTNWDEVGKGKVEVKPPQGSEWKKWAA
jgi:suppressor of G2 allele of SKP1